MLFLGGMPAPISLLTNRACDKVFCLFIQMSDHARFARTHPEVTDSLPPLPSFGLLFVFAGFSLRFPQTIGSCCFSNS